MFSSWLFSEITSFLLISEFLLCALAVTYSGVYVARYGDAIADHFGLSKAWIGIVLLAAITSVPELVSSTVAVTFLKSPDLAFGNIFGSNVFNVMIICVMEMVHRAPYAVLSLVSRRQILTVVLGIVLMMVGGLGIFLVKVVPAAFYFIFSALIVIIFIAGNRFIYKQEAKHHQSDPVPHEALSTSQLLRRFILWSAVIILCGYWLTQLVDVMAVHPFGARKIILGKSFAGTILLAIATSLPEVVVSITAVRVGAVEMAVGNVFGSNMCNVFFIPLLDLIYKLKYGVTIFFDVHRTHLIAMTISILLSLVAIAALALKRHRKRRGLSMEVVIMLAIYIIGNLFLVRFR